VGRLLDTLIARDAPTMYFIGVTTAQSSIMNVFPRWSEILGLGAQMVGIDAPIHAPVEIYRSVVEHIRDDPLSMGALITTHKIDLLDAASDLFDYLDPYAELCGEISCIAKRDGRLEGYALDPISSGQAWRAFVEAGHWGRCRGHVMCIGTGGTAVAIATYLACLPSPHDRPARFTAVNRSRPRLDRMRSITTRLGSDIEFEFLLNSDPEANDEIVSALPPGSMVINATGMGKDRPGSPITDAAVFPECGLVWELNYRGELLFLEQARRQEQQRCLRVEDGWGYFVYGWSAAVSEVFQQQITPDVYSRLEAAAAALRR
jgi:shikimate 5-dehydrogenase